MRTHRAPIESTNITVKQARAQFAMYLACARPEMLASVTADILCARFKLPRGEIERGLEKARGL